MELTGIPEEIANELMQAQAALAEGNNGKARVCSRRAVGKAFQLSNHLKDFAGHGSSVNANEILKMIADSADFPDEVREAARRLSTSVVEKGISERPIDDAVLIIQKLL